MEHKNKMIENLENQNHLLQDEVDQMKDLKEERLETLTNEI